MRFYLSTFIKNMEKAKPEDIDSYITNSPKESRPILEELEIID
jgi:hypothetical protein